MFSVAIFLCNSLILVIYERILGCLSRRDCVRVKEAYNRLFPNKKTLEETIQTVLKGQNNYMTACLLLMSEDAALTPLGSDKEEVNLIYCMLNK